MKVSELEGKELDYWTAKAEGYEIYENYPGQLKKGGVIIPEYHTEWKDCGPLIEKYKIRLNFSSEFGWIAEIWQSQKVTRGFDHTTECGDTPQQAICRAVVASIYGDEVDD